MERLSIDFRGPLPTTSRNAYTLTVVDEYSRFPFAFPCPNMHSSTVIKCLDLIFTLCGMLSYIHSDRGTSFLSQELKEYLSQRGISSCCRSRSDKDCFHHLTLALHLSLCCESDVHESIFMSLIFRFLLMVSLNRRRGRPLFL